MNWFLLSLLCAFSLASADAFTKWRLEGIPREGMLLVRFSIPGLLLSPVLFFHPLPAVPLAFWEWVLPAIPLELAAMMFYMKAIRLAPLYLTLPYLAFTPIFTAMLAYLLLHERISAGGLSGILMIAAGAFMLNLRHLGKGLLEPFMAIFREKGSRLMLLVALLYGITSVLGKGALEYCPPLTFGAFYFGLVGLISLPLAGRAYGSILARPFWPLVIGLMVSVMAASHFLALGKTDVAYMIAVKRTSLLFGILYGAILFRERGFGLHFAAGTIMVMGVAVISVTAS